jgi:hypothetical protein
MSHLARGRIEEFLLLLVASE